MRSLLHVILGVALIAHAGDVQAATKEPIRLKPSSKWQVDYAEKRCRLARSFGEGKQKVIALFDKYGPDSGYRVTLAGAPMRTNAPNGDIWLQFGPSEEKQQALFLSGNLGDEFALLLGSAVHIAGSTVAERKAALKKDDDDQIGKTPIDPRREEAVRYIEIGKPLRKAVLLETGSLRAPFAAMDKCVDDLMTDWGIDVEKHKSLTRSATPASDSGRWIVSSDYPRDMLSARQPALIEFRLSVGADGRATECHIQETTRPKEFDAAVCKALMRRAEFQPALDAGGKALPSYWRNRVRFQIAQ